MVTRRSMLIFGLFLVILAIGLALYWNFYPRALYGEAVAPPRPMPDFTLQSAAGPVSISDFRGKIVVLYFGYTSCPDLCPATLAFLRQAIDDLGDKANDVRVIFVSVDWKRDTPAGLAEYVRAYRKDFTGLTGTNAQIDAVTKDYGIFYRLNVPDLNGFYSVDHTASIQVLDRQQNLVLIWPHDTQPEHMESDLKELLKR
jgi:protein SCO1